MTPENKAKLILFTRRRLIEVAGLVLFLSAAASLVLFFVPQAHLVLASNIAPVHKLLGASFIALPLFFMAWGYAICFHRKRVWRVWRFAGAGVAFVGLNIVLTWTSLNGTLGIFLVNQLAAAPLFVPLLTHLENALVPALLSFSFLFAATLPLQWVKMFERRKKKLAYATPLHAANNLQPLVENLKSAAPPPKNPRFQEERRWYHRSQEKWNKVKSNFNMSWHDFKENFANARKPITPVELAPLSLSLALPPQASSEPPLSIVPPTPVVPAAAVAPTPAPASVVTKKEKRKGGKCPPFSLVPAPPKQKKSIAQLEQTNILALALDETLKDFKVKGEISGIHSGPVVSLFEFLPAAGVKSSNIIGLADDIARSMGAMSARIANIPGQNTMGIEIPNKEREDVHFAHLLNDPAFKKTDAHLPLILGTSISGAPIIADLAAMPHLLVAGTTGSGKSVALNAMILSLLYRLRPDECSFIMIDPKMLELSVYQDIPHLLTPVVTDPRKAVAALKWVVREMEERYKKMSACNVRNIGGFNEKAVKAGDDKLPFIVVIIDEMADLMMVAGKEIEAAVQRLAQMARAAGIHLIAATQRPSVDVITGTIKANFPTRISFQVSSKIDSRTILSVGGAEQLLGKGDMLWQRGGGKLERVHGPFVSDSHVEQVADFLRNNNSPPIYQEEVIETSQSDSPAAAFGGGGGGSDDDAELYQAAVALVRENKRASTSFLQRKLSIGYNRAARIIERMEENGVISAPAANGKRSILEPTSQNYENAS